MIFLFGDITLDCFYSRGIFAENMEFDQLRKVAGDKYYADFDPEDTCFPEYDSFVNNVNKRF